MNLTRNRYSKVLSLLLCFAMLMTSSVVVFAGENLGGTSEKVHVIPANEGLVLNEGLHELVIMGTTDIHAYVMPYDYMSGSDNRAYGLSRIATLVEQIRSERSNTLLIDTGDTIQGSMLGNMDAVIQPLKEGEVHSVIGSMNMMSYDAAILGNHEFNFGLDFLNRVYSDADFPVVNANVYKAGTDENYFEPYVILDREVDGKAIKIGVIGFVPPQIMIWDKMHLDGLVETREIVETAEKFIPMMKADGADLIIAVAHTGIEVTNNVSENAAYYLSQVPGIDAMLLGHQHKRFPSADYDGIEGIDIEKGTINGVPTIMPGAWGNNLGEITLVLSHNDDKWEVVSSQSALTAVANADGPVYAPNEEIVAFVTDRHDATIEYVNTPVGETLTELNTIFSRVMDNKAVQLINDAQLWFVESHFDNFVGTEYEGLPILSAAAPFLAGRHGAHYYTMVPVGGVAVRDIANLYIYDNTFQIVKIDADALLGWLEKNAENFNQIDPTSTEDQVLLDYNFRGFNFDHIDGIAYKIDVTQAVGERVVDVTYNGQPIESGMEFLVVTNNYRASGGGDHLRNAEIIYSGTEENREIIINYVTEMDGVSPELKHYWSIVPVETAGSVLFRSSPLGKDYIASQGIEHIQYVGDEEAWAIYEIDLAYNLNVSSDLVVVEAEEQETEIYMVVAGDVLWKIAKAHNTTWEALAALNGLENPNLILVGQKLLVPVK